MANRATIKYNGNTITEDREGGFVVNYNGSNLTTVSAGETRTFKCKDRYMKSVFKVGGRTLKCLDKLMATDVIVAVVSLFPSEPSSYSLIGTYTSSSTFTVPEDGHFQIEVFGASGNGGNGYQTRNASGGGGGGGGLAISRVKLKKGETVELTVGGVGSTTKAKINGSLVESIWRNPTVTSGSNGTDAVYDGDDGAYVGNGGAGGTASGGNYASYSGHAGSDGKKGFLSVTVEGGAGGNPGGYDNGYSGNYGGKGGSSKYGALNGESGKAGFIKIYRGNTNLA